MSQGGDVSDGTGKGDPHFHIADETFAVKHDEVGILGMANNGPDAPHSAATQVTRQPIPSNLKYFSHLLLIVSLPFQFYITLNPLKWLDGRTVAFGKVLTAEGLRVLKKLELLELNNERPIPEVTISDTKLLHQAS